MAEEKPKARESTEVPQQRQGSQGGQPSTGAAQSPGGRQQGMARRDWAAPSLFTGSPFTFMRRFSEEMDRLFEDFGMGRGWLMSRFGGERGFGQALWSPQVEICERDNQLVVSADLPGLRKEDVTVEIDENALKIHGERRQEHEETKENYHRSERSYGSFFRSIPLPEGVSPENAKATFQDGVLTVTLPLPQREERRGRRIEVQGASGSEGSAGQTKTAAQTSGQTTGR